MKKTILGLKVLEGKVLKGLLVNVYKKKELNGRKEFKKKSVERREEIKKAIYVRKKFKSKH